MTSIARVPAAMLVMVGISLFLGGSGTPDTAERRALAYLVREVPRWSVENHCFSCHNNGDAARALYVAVRSGFPVPPEALSATNAWLAKPEGWDHNGGEGPFSDKRLARIEFTAALALAVGAGQVKDRPALVGAAERLADEQASEGFWPIDESGRVGSPATYGRPLATAVASDALGRADAGRFQAPRERAERWLRRLSFQNNLDASAVLLACASGDDQEARAQCRRGVELLRKGESEPGGWGPYTNSPPEPFDTAVVLLALARVRDRADVSAMIGRGRAYLVATQAPDGHWPETTRPSGGESYAQRVSTSGWATQALLATREAGGPR